MCGFLYSSFGEVEKFERALHSLSHRGSDARGSLQIGAAHLGHQRLSIIDLSEQSNQPFHSVDGSLILIYNGEIYNYRELAEKHQLQCRTHSDTEVLLLLYQKLGERCLDELNGMFAFVIADKRDGSVFAARDRLGIKPIYIDRRGGQIAIASEVESLLALNGDITWDEVGLRQYAKLRTCFHGRTIYRGIEQLPAGCYFKNGKIVKWWSLPLGEQDAPADEELRELLVDAVELRKMSDVPLGSYLSGGLDSTLIAGLAEVGDVWSVGFESSNEFEFAQLAADQFGVQLHQCLVSPEEFQGACVEMVRKRCEPLSVPNEALIYLMTQQVKQRNTVVLSGEGADELFYGYDRIFRWAMQAEQFDLAEFEALYCYGSHKDDEIVASVIIDPYLKETDTVEQAVARFFQIEHLQGLLRRLDNATMLASVEARVPFVDHRIVERMAGVSGEYRMRGGIVKAPLKKAFSELVPEVIIQRKKVGFPVPLETIPFYDPKQSEGVIDQWLNFNLRILTGCDELYQQITHGSSQS